MRRTVICTFNTYFLVFTINKNFIEKAEKEKSEAYKR